jgi:hypothetical protein
MPGALPRSARDDAKRACIEGASWPSTRRRPTKTMTVDPSVGRRCKIFPSSENKGAGTKRRSAWLSRPPCLGEKTAGSSAFGRRGASQAAHSSALELDSRDERTPPVFMFWLRIASTKRKRSRAFLFRCGCRWYPPMSQLARKKAGYSCIGFAISQ